MASTHDRPIAPSDDPLLIDRRRPGRVENVSSHLIPLLRRSELEKAAERLLPEAEPLETTGSTTQPLRNDLGAISGIALASVLGGAIWVCIWLILRSWL